MRTTSISALEATIHCKTRISGFCPDGRLTITTWFESTARALNPSTFSRILALGSTSSLAAISSMPPSLTNATHGCTLSSGRKRRCIRIGKSDAPMRTLHRKWTESSTQSSCPTRLPQSTNFYMRGTRCHSSYSQSQLCRLRRKSLKQLRIRMRHPQLTILGLRKRRFRLRAHWSVKRGLVC